MPIVIVRGAQRRTQFDAAFEAMKRERVDGVLVARRRDLLGAIAPASHELLAKHRLPSVLGGRD